MKALDPWRDQLRGDPVRTVAGVLEGWLDRGPWQRTEPVDFLLDLADGDVELSECTATALLDWTREKLTWDDRRRLRYGERAHAGQLADALATLQRLDAPHAAYRLAEQHPWFEVRIRPLRFDEYLDLPRLLWFAIAFHQPDERFLTRWLDMCGRAALLSSGWREWLRIGLTGLRKLPGKTLPAEQQALAGLLLFGHKVKTSYSLEATEFAERQFGVLKDLFPRGPQYWPSVLQEVQERLAENRSLPVWMSGKSMQTKPKGRPVAPPTQQDRRRMARRINEEPITNALWQAVGRLFNRYFEHARHTGESEYLVKTVSHLGSLLLKRQPGPPILRGLLAWIRTAMDWDAGNDYLWSRLASCYLALGQVAEAENTLWEAVRRFPNMEVNRNILAKLLWDEKKLEEAETLLHETMDRFTDGVYCRNILAKLLCDEKKTKEAETLLRETMDRFTDDVACRNILAKLLWDENRTEKAETLLRETMDRFTDDVYCRNILAKLLWDEKKTEEAEALLRETMDRFPDDEISQRFLAVLLWDRDKAVGAAEIVQETIPRKSDDELYRELGLEPPLDEDEAAQAASVTRGADQSRRNREDAPPSFEEPTDEAGLGQGELLIPQFGGGRGLSMPTHELMDDTRSPLDDDPFPPWAAERAPLIQLVYGIGQLNGVQEALLEAARNGGAAEVAEVALRLLFPDDALPVEDALRARPDSVALRLFQSGQNADVGLRLAGSAPEAQPVLSALYESAADPSSWNTRFRDAVLACADLAPPPAWRGILGLD